jgi:hypothetical protein
MTESIGSPSQDLFRGLLTATSVLAGIGALIWLRFAEPWYGHQLVERMRVGGYQAPWRDETSKISDLIPDGGSRAAAVALLDQNGFSCIRSVTGNNPEQLQLQCTRKTSSFVCSVSYVVSFVVDRDKTLGLHAQSYQACL